MLLTIKQKEVKRVNLLSWILFGFIAGFVAHLIDPTDVRGGLVGTTVIGILGALVGGFLANTFLGLDITGFNLQSFIIAVAGALILVFLERALLRKAI